MDTKKFEKLITLVINEDNDAASALFHDIVVEKSREIFESIMDEDDLEEGMGGQVGGLLDEIEAEESDEGMYEEEEEMDMDVEADMDDDMDDDMNDEMDFDDEMSGDDFEDDGEEIEDAVIRIEDKLDQLMAEFEEIMGGDEEADFGGEDDMGDEDDMVDEEDMDEEEAMMENVQLQKVSVTHGDNGQYTKSPGLQGSGQAGMDSHPVKFAGSSESVPTGPKGASNFYAKGETSVKNAGNFKNSPGKGNFKEKGEAAPKPAKGDNGSNAKSPVAESRRTTRRPIR